MNYNEMAKLCHEASYNWWHDSEGNKLDRNKGELLMLVVSEISEAMEALRKDLMDDHLPHRKGAEVELADAAIRLFDFAGGFGIEFLYEYENFGDSILIYKNQAESLLCLVDEVINLYRYSDSSAVLSYYIEEVIRDIFLIGKQNGYDIEGAIFEKMEYNKHRADHKPENRMKKNGKKF